MSPSSSPRSESPSALSSSPVGEAGGGTAAHVPGDVGTAGRLAHLVSLLPVAVVAVVLEVLVVVVAAELVLLSVASLLVSSSSPLHTPAAPVLLRRLSRAVPSLADRAVPTPPLPRLSLLRARACLVTEGVVAEVITARFLLSSWLMALLLPLGGLLPAAFVFSATAAVAATDAPAAQLVAPVAPVAELPDGGELLVAVRPARRRWRARARRVAGGGVAAVSRAACSRLACGQRVSKRPDSSS